MKQYMMNLLRGTKLSPYPAWVGYEPHLIPPLRLMHKEGINTLEEWFRWAEEWSINLRSYTDITPESCVLEIGCGLGRIAFPLRYILSSQGSYSGFEICQYKIKFLEKTFHQAYPNFKFTWANIHNTFYNPQGLISAKDYQFPYADHSFDVIFAASVFTHLLPETVEHYFQEVARVLKPNGHCLFSFFLLDYYQPGKLRPLGFSRPEFNFDYYWPSSEQQCAVCDLNQPEKVTAYRLEMIQNFAQQAGLKLEQEPIPGLWSGTTDRWVSAQDLVILKSA